MSNTHHDLLAQMMAASDLRSDAFSWWQAKPDYMLNTVGATPSSGDEIQTLVNRVAGQPNFEAVSTHTRAVYDGSKLHFTNDGYKALQLDPASEVLTVAMVLSVYSTDVGMILEQSINAVNGGAGDPRLYFVYGLDAGLLNYHNLLVTSGLNMTELSPNSTPPLDTQIVVVFRLDNRITATAAEDVWKFHQDGVSNEGLQHATRVQIGNGTPLQQHDWYLGARAGALVFSELDLRELVIFNSYLTDDDCVSLSNTLANDWP